MRGTPRQLTADRGGQLRGIIMHHLQQPENGVTGIVEIRLHRRIFTVSGKGVLRQVVRAEAQEIDMRCDAVDRQRRGGCFNHRAQGGQRSFPTFIRQAAEGLADDDDILRQGHHRDQDEHVEFARQAQDRAQLCL